MSIKALWTHLLVILAVFFAATPLPLWGLRDAVVSATAVVLSIGIVFLSSAMIRRSDRIKGERAELEKDAAKWRYQEKTSGDVF